MSHHMAGEYDVFTRKKGVKRERETERQRRAIIRIANCGCRFTNLLADLATLSGEPPVRVGARGELRERRLLGLLEAEDEDENSAYQHNTHRDRVRVLRVLQQQADVIHDGDARCS